VHCRGRRFPYLVAVLDGAVAGYASAGPYRAWLAYDFTVEDSVYIAPEAQRRDIGRALLDRVIVESETSSYRQMIAVIGDPAQAASIALYAAAGFAGSAHSMRSVSNSAAGSTASSCSARSAKARRGRHRHSARDHAERAIDGSQHTLKLVTAPHDQSGRRDHAVDALTTRQSWILFDSIDRHFRAAAEDGEHRAVLEEVDRVIAPLTGGDLAAIEGEETVELAPIEGHAARWDGGWGCYRFGPTPVILAGFNVAWTKGHRRLHLSSSCACHS